VDQQAHRPIGAASAISWLTCLTKLDRLRYEWWLDDLAAELAMPPITLHSWLRRGWVHARQESRRPHRWIIHADHDQLAELRQRRSRPPGWYTRRRWADSEPPAHNGSRDHADSPRI
jgi:hypothetical protein